MKKKLACVFTLLAVVMVSKDASAFGVRANYDYGLAGGGGNMKLDKGTRLGLDAYLYEGKTFDLYLTVAKGNYLSSGSGKYDNFSRFGSSSGATFEIQSNTMEVGAGLHVKLAKYDTVTFYIPIEALFVTGDYTVTATNTVARTYSPKSGSLSGSLENIYVKTGIGLDVGLGSNWNIGAVLGLSYGGDGGQVQMGKNTGFYGGEQVEMGILPEYFLSLGLGVRYSF